MSDLIANVQAALQRALAAAGLAAEASPLVVAVSGGPDSLALLDALARLLPAEQLIVAHLDHALRSDSAADTQAVAALATARGLRFHTERVDVAVLAHERRLSLEDAGRSARYAFLARVAEAEGAAAVVAGHNAGDQAETVLMHLLRGAGVAGLRGMSPAAPVPGRPDLWLLRPLLGIERTTIEQYLRDNGLEPLRDATNRDVTFRRNRVRHELLPALESYNPQIRDRLREMAAVLAAEDDLLRDLEAAAWQTIWRTGDPGRVLLDRAAWTAQPLALRRRLLRRAVAQARPVGSDLSFRAIEEARAVAERGPTGARASLGGGLFLRVAYDHLEIAAATSAPDEGPQLPGDEAMSLPVPGRLKLGVWYLTAEIVPAPDPAALAAQADPWTAYVALDDDAALVVRPRRPGERIRPLGLGAATKLKEVMINRKIPAAARARWPLVATEAHPLWLAGHSLDDRARVHPDSPRVVRLRCGWGETKSGLLSAGDGPQTTEE